MELEDALFDRVLGDQSVDDDWPCLPDSVCAVCGLVLDRWVPSTNTHIHDPHAVTLTGPVTAVVEEGRIAAFEGAPSAVGEVRAFYDRVSTRLGSL